jgi:hypothetical protein
MNGTDKQQWLRREGYGGPGSFPEEVMGFVRERSEALAGQEHSLYLSDGRVLHYAFKDGEVLTAKALKGGHGFDAEDVKYKAFESTSGIFFVNHAYPGNERLNTSVILDLNRNQVVVVDCEIPEEGADDYRVRKNQVGGCIGEPVTHGEIIPPPFPSDLVGKRFIVNYASIYTYDTVIFSERLLAWHCLKGNPGIADIEEYSANQLAPGVFVLSWSEQAETLSAVMLWNFSTGEINGNMFGYEPEQQKVLDFTLGSEILDPGDFRMD